MSEEGKSQDCEFVLKALQVNRVERKLENSRNDNRNGAGYYFFRSGPSVILADEFFNILSSFALPSLQNKALSIKTAKLYKKKLRRSSATRCVIYTKNKSHNCALCRKVASIIFCS